MDWAGIVTRHGSKSNLFRYENKCIYFLAGPCGGRCRGCGPCYAVQRPRGLWCNPGGCRFCCSDCPRTDRPRARRLNQGPGSQGCTNRPRTAPTLRGSPVARTTRTDRTHPNDLPERVRRTSCQIRTNHPND